MKPSELLSSRREDSRRIVEQNHACNARVFGSVLRGEDTDDSDLDLLVDSTPETTLFDLAHIKGKLQVLLGVPVDVFTPKALPEKFRDRLLSDAILV